jgi:flagellar L-ring protein precursor FlgH
MSIAPKLAFLFAAGISGTIVVGQTAPGGTGQQADASHKAGVAADEQTPAKPMNNNAAVEAGAMMGRNGGSLLRATMMAKADPSQAKLAQISFFAVPAPEPKTLKKHDLVTIIVNEASSASSKAQNDLAKNVELKAEIAQMIKLKLGKGSIYGLPTPTSAPGVDFTGDRTFHGQGEMDRSDTITARITAEILDVKPNGTLVLQARKHIKTDDEEQQFILTGICRAEDINPDNTVISTQLYDMSLQKNSKGDVRESTERGRLPKLLDFLNPF